MRKNAEAVQLHLSNPDLTLDNIAAELNVSRIHVHNILEKHYDDKVAVFVAPSLFKDRVYFAFNGINEREFHTDNNNFLLDSSMFSAKEKQALRTMGFKCYND